MSTILVKLKKDNNRLIKELIEKLGGNVLEVNDAVVEDILLGTLMDNVKTGNTVTKASIMKKLKTK